MWPFRRKEQTPVPGPIATPVIRSDWKGMPALQRAIGEHPLTAPGEVFAGELATRHDPSVVSRTLGHHVSAEAPSGLVLAVGSTSTRSDGPTMTTRSPVQRRAASPADAVDTEESAASPSEPARPATSSEVMANSRRELPIVATAEPEVKNLTRLAPDTMPLPVGPGRRFELQRSTAPSIAPEPTQESIHMAPLELTASSAPAKLTLGQSRRLGLGAPLRQVPATSVQRSTAGLEIPTQAASPRTGEESA
ncbi:MAG TPA: hypothetical protein VLS53_00995, partial [Candidatus Dormibacteraeota bacterium]|nr:hypothetical protein [Candidatus Dormibacteraeota bacterium]